MPAAIEAEDLPHLRRRRAAAGVTAKDIVLGIIGHIGTDGATGHVIEYAGSAIRALSMEGRMTVCNMSIEAGARAGMIAPDETTFAYLKDRGFSPQGAAWDEAVAAVASSADRSGRNLRSRVRHRGRRAHPYVTWGTNPGMVVPVTGHVPGPTESHSEAERRSFEPRPRPTWTSNPALPIEDIAIDRVFIGSCTNSRIEDLRAAAKVVTGYHVHSHVRAMVVPGSQPVKAQAEQEGLDKIFLEAGFEWREPGCSMCLGMNPDILQPGERCASTSNRNFEGRQGRGGRTHLVSPRWPQPQPSPATSPISANGNSKARRSGLMQPFRVRSIPSSRRLIAPTSTPTRSSPSSSSSASSAPATASSSSSTGAVRPEFFVNQPRYQGAQILVAAKNFGCGSSREHAAWALFDYGFRCVIAPSFADIFHSNAGKNGILLVTLPEKDVDHLLGQASHHEGYRLTVSLEDETIHDDHGFEAKFSIDPFRRYCLLEGLDDIGLTLRHAAALDAFETTHNEKFWLAPRA